MPAQMSVQMSVQMSAQKQMQVQVQVQKQRFRVAKEGCLEEQTSLSLCSIRPCAYRSIHVCVLDLSSDW
jgi:hypothetical protein